MRYPDFDGTQSCAEVGDEFFFPDTLSEAAAMYVKAREICHRCDWEIECGEWALHHDNGYGMFGGLTPEDRRLIRKHRAIVNKPIKVSVPKAVSYETQNR